MHSHKTFLLWAHPKILSQKPCEQRPSLRQLVSEILTPGHMTFLPHSDVHF